MQRRTTLVAAALLAAGFGPAVAQAGKNLTIVEPKDGASVGSPFKVRFEVRGMKLAPAGDEAPGTGHHHLLINGDALAKGEEIPFTRRFLHLSKGQSEVEVTLPAGTYKLTAQFGDGSHKSLGPDFAHTITVTVK
jgi:hypothetical protein